MAIFKKVSPLEGNPCTPAGKQLEFKGMYFETSDEAEIELLKGFSCYQEVEAKDEVVSAKPVAAPKAATGVISAAKLADMAAQNK